MELNKLKQYALIQKLQHTMQAEPPPAAAIEGANRSGSECQDAAQQEDEFAIPEPPPKTTVSVCNDDRHAQAPTQ